MRCGVAARKPLEQPFEPRHAFAKARPIAAHVVEIVGNESPKRHRGSENGNDDRNGVDVYSGECTRLSLRKPLVAPFPLWEQVGDLDAVFSRNRVKFKALHNENSGGGALRCQGDGAGASRARGGVARAAPRIRHRRIAPGGCPGPRCGERHRDGRDLVGAAVRSPRRRDQGRARCRRARGSARGRGRGVARRTRHRSRGPAGDRYFGGRDLGSGRFYRGDAAMPEDWAKRYNTTPVLSRPSSRPRATPAPCTRHRAGPMSGPPRDAGVTTGTSCTTSPGRTSGSVPTAKSGNERSIAKINRSVTAQPNH